VNHDPVVKEVQEAGAKLAGEAGYDVHRFFENLREVQEELHKLSARKPVSEADRRACKDRGRHTG